ncbi:MULTISPECIES: 5-formyltetrahydrofolate cyclo-ligase [unclassified Kitasatospora]|uniref:5-formyltetrahydrofolate cyclo-ligase n=1 Tax=unclassified Kitasatospora TaxID=2633591 RepID=UPI00071069D9|nr:MULTISPECIES: 5-formyltetrahydrofolate cyclo-ligase [unclassified Kitasatospora]KQV24036.1 5-formyltetrahydrofolate cyclo-ligase [Kitasatospora sp. Root107]KRB67250.1 5-formyltetrahydrofolate cyclo-ligase [Kitasatospora sp. Root187]
MHNDKAGLRSRLLAERRELSPERREHAAARLAAHAGSLARAGQTVAAYVSVGGEPGTRPLLDALRADGVRVLLPVLLPDNDLDWAEYQGPESLAPAGRGLLEPTGPRLGPDAVCAAELVLLPGLAVDRRGIRLGRGGGSYDRVLARLTRRQADPVLATLLYDTELLDTVPAEPHDLPVHAVVTPSGVHRLAG